MPRNVDERRIGNSAKPPTGADEESKTCTARDTASTLHCAASECTGNPSSAAVTLPDCNCGSVGSRRLGLINRAVIQTSGTIAEKGAGMGDKGGKKDKDKNKQQQLTKQKQEQQKKH